MTRRLMLVAILMLAGCGDPTIRCWYTVGRIQMLGEPWIEMVGRTDRFSSEVHGPFFVNAAAARQYVIDNKLKMCAGDP